MIRVLIVDGVTGAGKSQTLRALQAHLAGPTLLREGRVIPEEEKLGEFMAELRQPDLSATERLARLYTVLDEPEHAALVADQTAGYMLQPLHLSYYALLPDWRLYQPLDDRLHALHSQLVLLEFAPQLTAERALDRVDRQASTWTQEMIAYYGSRAAALEAIALSQARRPAGLALTRLPSLAIETTTMDWATYADQIIAFWQRPQNSICLLCSPSAPCFRIEHPARSLHWEARQQVIAQLERENALD